MEQVVAKQFCPEILYFLTLREKPMPADVEPEAPIFDGPGDPADIPRIAFQNRDGRLATREEIGRG